MIRTFELIEADPRAVDTLLLAPQQSGHEGTQDVRGDVLRAPHRFRPATEGLLRVAAEATKAGFRVTRLVLRDSAAGPASAHLEQAEAALQRSLQDGDLAVAMRTFSESVPRTFFVAELELAEKETGTRVRLTRYGDVQISRFPGAERGTKLWRRLLDVLTNAFRVTVTGDPERS